MSTLAKVFIVFNLILTVVFFGSSATLFMMRYNWREAYQTYRKDTGERFAKLEVSHTQTDSMVREVTAANQKLQTESAQKAAVVNTQKEEIASLTTTIGTKDGLIQQKDNSIEASQKTIQEALAKITAQEDHIGRLQEIEKQANSQRNQAVRDSTRLAVDLAKKEQELSETLILKAEAAAEVEKYEVVLANLAAQGIDTKLFYQPKIDGIVEAVNSTDRLVVLSVGKEQKVQEGFLFAVNRGGEYIGKVKVIEVYDDLSGARITYIKDANEIEVGDTIVSSRF